MITKLCLSLKLYLNGVRLVGGVDWLSTLEDHVIYIHRDHKIKLGVHGDTIVIDNGGTTTCYKPKSIIREYYVGDEKIPMDWCPVRLMRVKLLESWTDAALQAEQEENRAQLLSGIQS